MDADDILQGSAANRGQAALEFFIMVGLVLIMFIFSFVIYQQNFYDSQVMEDRLAATQLCLRLASEVSSLSSLGGNSSYTLSLPEQLNYKNYTVWIISDKRKVSIDYITIDGNVSGAACSLQTTGITNYLGNSSFILGKNATMQLIGGKISVTP